MSVVKATIAALSLSVLMTGCENAGDATLRDYSGTFAPLPEVPHPIDNPYSAAKAELGELLFWDPILSGDQNIACATCHHPDFGWADGRPFSVGTGGHGLGPDRYDGPQTPIHSPTIMNVAFTGITVDGHGSDFVAGPYFWDLRAATLEEQAIGPIKNPVEMLGQNYSVDNIEAEILERLNVIDDYQVLFQQAFGGELGEAVTIANLQKALATFQRTVADQGSRFDQFLRGETQLFSEAEVIGLNAFIDSGCADCHNGPMLSDNQLDKQRVVLPHVGPVRTPSLRNISKTAPYFQDGSAATLGAAINAYDDRDDLGTGEEDDFINIDQFLLTLDAEVYSDIPASVPSGLPVGGDI